MAREKSRRFFALVITLSLVLSLMPTSVMAETTAQVSDTQVLEGTILSEETSGTAPSNNAQTSGPAKSTTLDAQTETSVPSIPKTMKQIAPLSLPATATIGDVFDDGTFRYKITSETSVSVGDGTDGGAMANAPTSYSTLSIPSSVSYLGQDYAVTSVANRAFYQRTDIIGSLNIPGSISAIGQDAFREIRTIEHYTLNEGLKTIGQAAWQDTSFASITVPSTVTSLGKNAFRERVGLPYNTTVTFAGKLTSTDPSITEGRSVKFTVNFLDNDGALVESFVVSKDATLPASLPAVPASAGASGKWYPESGFSLTDPVTNSFTVSPTYVEVVLGQTFEVGPFTYQVTSSDSVQVGTGSALSGLSTNPQLDTIADLTIPSKVTRDDGFEFKVTAISPAAFQGLTAPLDSITIPGSVTSIGRDAFRQILNVGSFTLSEGLQSIGQAAFQDTVFTSIAIPSSVTSLAKNAFRDQTSIPNDKVIFLGQAPTNLVTDSVASGRTVFFTVTFVNTDGTVYETRSVQSGQAVSLPTAPASQGYAGEWLAPTGYSFTSVSNSFAAQLIYPLDLTGLDDALKSAAALVEENCASGDWAAIKTAESRAQALYTMFSDRIASGETVEVEGLDEFKKSIAYQVIVDDAAELLQAAITNGSGRFAPEQQYFVAKTGASKYDSATKAPAGALAQGSIFTASLDRLSGIVKTADKTFARFPSISYAEYSAQDATWFKLADGSYAKRSDLQDYPILGYGNSYQVKVVTNNISNALLPFSWSAAGESVAWGSLLNVKTVNDNWVVYTISNNGGMEYRYLPVDVITPTNPADVPTAPAENDPNIWDPTSTPKDPGDPTVPGHTGYQPSGLGDGDSPVSVVGAWPANGSTGVGLNDRFYLAFSNNVAGPTNPFTATNLSLVSLQKADGTPVAAKVSASSLDELRRYIFIQPIGQLEYGTNYKIVINPGITNKNEQVSTAQFAIAFSTLANPYASDAGTDAVGSPSGNTITFGSKTEAYKPSGTDTNPGTGTTPGTGTDNGTGGTNPETKPGTGTTTKPGSSTKPGTSVKPAADSDTKTASTANAEKSSDESSNSDSDTESKSEKAKTTKVAENSTAEDTAETEGTAVPIDGKAAQTQNDAKPSGNRAPIAPGVLIGIIAALIIVGAVAARQYSVTKKRRSLR